MAASDHAEDLIALFSFCLCSLSCGGAMAAVSEWCCVIAATASLAIHRQETDEIVNTALSDTLVLTGEEEFVRFES